MHADLGQQESCGRGGDDRIEAIVQKRVAEELSKASGGSSGSANAVKAGGGESQHRRFSKKTSKLATGAARSTKADFQQLLDFGVPTEPKESGPGDKEVLIFYGSADALPSDRGQADAATYESGDGLPMLSAADATANCDAVNVVAVGNPGHTRQCIALVSNYESYHVQRWMRLKSVRGTPEGAIEPKQPLRHASRGHAAWGKRDFLPPSPNKIRTHWTKLQEYLGGLDNALEKLKPIAERIAIKNTIIVLTCNRGQSELLMNFACNAKAKGFELGNVIVFATDKDTEDLAKNLGLATYYDDKFFRSIPTEGAKRYGDRNFVAMMIAKVLCVHMIVWLGYDVLFQDVDIIWFKNPLDYYHDGKLSGDFDMYFQDDGVRTIRYAPYSANSGFYYVRNNERTKYLFTQLLYAGDLIQSWDSHQQVLVQLLAEHSSLFGLRVKVHERNTEEFPGGFHYHRRKNFMKDIIQGKRHPYIFHMSWTENKDNKLKYFQQLGEWYVEHSCIGKSVEGILAGNEPSSQLAIVEPCCSKEAILTCHYKDKASKIPCNDKPAIDKDGKPFWVEKDGKIM